MRTWAGTGFVLVAVLAMAPGAWAQYGTMQASDNTIAVVVSGRAEAEPEWVDVNLSIKGSGTSAVMALMEYQDKRDRTLAALMDEGVEEESIKSSFPAIGGSDYGYGGPMMMEGPGGAETPTFHVTGTMTIRINKPEMDTLAEDISNLIDAAAIGGATTGSSMGPYTPSGSVVFGVDDPKPLEDEALADALKKARALAGETAAKAGREIGDLVSVTVWDSGLGSRMSSSAYYEALKMRPKAYVSASVVVSYALKAAE